MPASRRNTLKGLVLGLFVAVAFTILAMLAMAALMIAVPLSNRLITTINQFIKAIAIVIGTITAVPRGGEKGLVSGVLIALFYTIIGYICYLSLGGGCFSFTGMMGELLIGAAAGAVTGAVRANLKPKHKSRAKHKS